MKKISLILLCLLATVSCTRFSRLKKLESTLEQSNDFNDILALKYLRYSDILKRNYDYTSSSYFAKLGLESYNRKNKFSLVLDDTMKDTKPETLADLYFLFNCWLYFETNNKNIGEATICKDSFTKLTNLLEKNKNIALQNKVVDEDDDETKFLTKEEELYFIEFSKQKTINIFFDYDNFKLNPEALVKISSVLKYINGLKEDYKVLVVGHADRAGKVIYNNTLARKRANTVYNVLIKNGVPRELVTVESLSSKSPKVLTRQNEKNQLNRRVEITIITDQKSLDLNPQTLKFNTNINK
ncbi:MAG: OmpA family protein [Rickettsiales bacterium]|nr:OmpA family protein [Rickettsiales bacterium]